jgi:intein/homing endonuclease
MEAREKENTLDMYMSIQTTKGIRASSDKPLLASFLHLFWCGDGTIYRERSEAITA